jgi:uncharacterized DUF497 family protein
MWTVLESRDAAKALDKAPAEVVRKFQVWRAIVQESGPAGLRAIKGFHDEALLGPWRGHRSSRLNLQWRVIYRVQAKEVLVNDGSGRDRFVLIGFSIVGRVLTVVHVEHGKRDRIISVWRATRRERDIYRQGQP